jgi:pyruvyltransferase
MAGNSFSVSSNLELSDGSVPLTYWVNTPNFGDLLSPYLINKLTGLPTKLVETNKSGIGKYVGLGSNEFSYLAIGSIISRANNNSIVWGSGAFGTERAKYLSAKATYLAVRGPLTRNLLRINGIDCPAVYGDPALLLPKVFNPSVDKKYKVGVILRWSEGSWNSVRVHDDVKKIYLGTDNIEGTINDILQCEQILSSSLHGVILADAYGIPSAWLMSGTPKGLEFKFYDYFISVNKIQKPQALDFNVSELSAATVEKQIRFNKAEIEYDPAPLLNVCPFIVQ